MADRPKPIGPHDLGGLPAAEVDLSEHDYAFWERRVDALVFLLFNKGIVTDWSQIRHRIESLGPGVYENLSYYERWAGAVGALLVEQGVLTEHELEQRISDVRQRSNK